MMRIGFLIRKINGSRLPAEVQRRAWSVASAAAMEQPRMKDADIELEQARPFEDIPGPKPLPLIGNMFRFIPYLGEFSGDSQAKQMQTFRDKYGDIVILKGIPSRRPMVILFTPELCERMYRVQGLWPTRIAMESLHYYRTKREDIYGKQYGLATSQDKVWHDFRSKVNQPIMQPRAVKPHVAQISEVTSDFLNKMRTMRDPDNLEMPDNFNNELYKWALESICAIGLNCRLGCLEPNLAADSEPQIMINCVHDMFDLMYRMEILPSLWKLYNTRDLKKFFRTLDTVNRISSKHIERVKAELNEGSTARTDEREPSILEKLLHIDEQTARVMVLDMLLAGVDTTGNTAGGLLYNIAIHPDKQEKLREEVMSLLPNKTSPVTPSILNQTTYAKACMKESLRMYSVSIGTLRTMQEDVNIGGYRIPKGCDVLACHSLISMDPKQFPQPTKFIPERWLRDDKKDSLPNNAHPFAYMPFGFGARTCIGRRFAEMELETLLLTVIRNFRLEWHREPMKFKNKFINTLGMPLRLKLIDL